MRENEATQKKVELPSCPSPVYYSGSLGTIPSLGVLDESTDQKTIQATNLKEGEGGGGKMTTLQDLPFH